jgi:hypothetical protein
VDNVMLEHDLSVIVMQVAGVSRLFPCRGRGPRCSVAVTPRQARVSVSVAINSGHRAPEVARAVERSLRAALRSSILHWHHIDVVVASIESAP